MEFININAKATLEWLAQEDGVHNPQFNEHEESGFEAINFLYAGTLYSIDNEDDVIIKPVGATANIKYSNLIHATSLLSAASLKLWSM